MINTFSVFSSNNSNVVCASFRTKGCNRYFVSSMDFAFEEYKALSSEFSVYHGKVLSLKV